LKKRFIAVFLVLLFLLTGGCGSRDSTGPRQTLPERVSVHSLQVGDTVAGLAVTSLDVRDDNNFIVGFAGRAIVSGRYIHHENEQWGRTIAIYVDPGNITVPVFKEDQRDVWFVLRHTKQAEHYFPFDTEGEVSITIENYRIDHRETDSYNLADFVELN